VSIEKQCKILNIEYTKINVEALEEFFSSKVFDHILIAGAGLLPENLSDKFKIINAHPGYLPNTKGLDAYKWAVYHGHPIGVTTHYISGKADEGQLIERRTVPVYFEDTFHSVAYRIYDTEIDMLVNAPKIVEANKATLEDLADQRYQANKRMPHHYEIIMMERFEAMRKASKSHREY
ncbi:MAG: formyltransferase family protein, partial [Bacteroidota bacterium]